MNHIKNGWKALAALVVFLIAFTPSTLAAEQSHPFSELNANGNLDLGGNSVLNIDGINIGHGQHMVVNPYDPDGSYSTGIGGLYGISFLDQDGFNVFYNDDSDDLVLSPGDNGLVNIWRGLDVNSITAGYENQINFNGDQLSEVEKISFTPPDQERYERAAIDLENNDIEDVNAIHFTKNDFRTAHINGLTKLSFGPHGSSPPFFDGSTGDLLLMNADLEINQGLDVSGTKNFVHDINSTHEAVYTSQESASVRAVIEGQTTVEDGQATVRLPDHFAQVVSDTGPRLRVQVTPHDLAQVAVTSRSRDAITIEATEDVTVDYRVTGIRAGYTDKNIIQDRSDGDG